MDWIFEYATAYAFPEGVEATGAMLVGRGTYGVRLATSGLGRIDLEPLSNKQSGLVTMLRFRVRK